MLHPQHLCTKLCTSRSAKAFLNIDVQILWQTGDSQYNKYKRYNNINIHVTPFINNMANAYALADLVVCRSGALTLAEITVCGKPSILIPYPYAAGDHQTKNAKYNPNLLRSSETTTGHTPGLVLRVVY